MKDKKPFTYTPGGLDLSEIRSPRMQRRLSRNASLEGAKVSPLARPHSDQPSTGPAGTPAMSSGVAVQVFPMMGMGMPNGNSNSAKGHAKSKKPKAVETPPPQPKPTCGPAPMPPPFALGDSGQSKHGGTAPRQAESKESSDLPSGPVSTISSPTFEPKSPTPSLVSTASSLNENGVNGHVPAPPPLPPFKPANRRDSVLSTASSIQDERSPLQQSELIFNGRKNSLASTDNISCTNGDTSFMSGEAEPAGSDTSSMILDDCSMTNSTLSIAAADDYFEPVNNTLSVNSSQPMHSSNESLLKQISSIEQIAAKHNKHDVYSKNYEHKIGPEEEEKKIQQEKENRLRLQEEKLREEQEKLCRQREAQRLEDAKRARFMEDQLQQAKLKEEEEKRLKEEQDRAARMKKEEDIKQEQE